MVQFIKHDAAWKGFPSSTWFEFLKANLIKIFPLTHQKPAESKWLSKKSIKRDNEEGDQVAVTFIFLVSF